MSFGRVSNHEFRELKEKVRNLERRFEEMADATQTDIDALTTQLTQVQSDLQSDSDKIDASTSKLQTEIDSLVAANPGVNVDGLRAVASQLDPVAQSLGEKATKIGDLTPTPPAPPTPTP